MFPCLPNTAAPATRHAPLSCSGASPALRTEYDARLKDPAFAGSPEARLLFFYQRHPAWDERVNLVPVLRVATSPVDAGR